MDESTNRGKNDRGFPYQNGIIQNIDTIPRCDACRKRKICCTRDAYENACSLCKTRGESCTYVLPPNVRRNRQVSTARQSASASASGSRPGTSTSSGAVSSPRDPFPPTQSSRSNIVPSSVQESKPEWICQFVGMSGDQDPYVLRHCSFNHLNCYKAHNWAILRVKSNNELPLHFTVRLMVPCYSRLILI